MKASELVNRLDAAQAYGVMKAIYMDEKRIPAQLERYRRALKEFIALYGDVEARIFSAPGRSEVGGNHTDHQHGKVLACSLNLDIIAVVEPTDTGIVELKSDNYPLNKVNLSDLEIHENKFGTTEALIRGVAAGFVNAGYQIGGFRAYATSEVLSGSGMSSSAAFEVITGTIFSGLYNEMRVDSTFLAVTGQYAENCYFGKPCGLMDQMACATGGLVYIDFENPAEPKVQPLAVDFDAFGHSLCIVDTKGSHADLTDEYAAVPTEMKKIAAHYGKDVLREVDIPQFTKDIRTLRSLYGDRAVLRAIHFFAENDRVDLEKEALEQGDFPEFLALIKESGASSFQFLQNVYSVKKVQEQGLSLGLAVSELALGKSGACRVHGGGFAGTIQAFVPDDIVEQYRQALDAVFGEGSCLVLKIRPMGGICVSDRL